MGGSGVLFWRKAARRQGQLMKGEAITGESDEDSQDGGGKVDCPCGGRAVLYITS